MAGPWEDFQNTPTESGPWDDFSPKGPAKSKETPKVSLPDIDGIAAIRSVFPDIKINENKRDPSSLLGMANPSSYHNYGRNAVDIPAIPGMTFEQAKKRLLDQGYTFAEAIDEYNNPSPHSTGGHWHFVFGGAPEKVESAPWEDFQPQVEEGPWADFGAAPEKPEVSPWESLPQLRTSFDAPQTALTGRERAQANEVNGILREAVSKNVSFDVVRDAVNQKFPGQGDDPALKQWFDYYRSGGPADMMWQADKNRAAENADVNEIVVEGDMANASALGQGLQSQIDAYKAAGQRGFPGLAAREIVGALNPELTDEQIAQIQKDLREELDYRAEKSSGGGVGGFVATLPGSMLGGAGPEYLLPGAVGTTAAGRLGTAFGINALTDVGYQAADVAAGVQDEISGEQAVLSGITGVAFQGSSEVIRAIAGKYSGTGAGLRPVGENGKVLEVSESFDNLPKVVGRTRKGSPMDVKTKSVSQRVASTTRGWTNAPNIVVYTNFAALKKADPKRALDMETDGATKSPGFYGDDGTVHIIADNVKDEGRIEAILYHEALTHDGLAKEFGEGLTAKMSELYQSNWNLRRKANDLAAGKYGQAYAPNKAVAEALKKAEEIPNKGLRRQAIQKIMDENPEMAAKLAEEVLAKSAESGIVTKNILDKLTVFFRQYGRKLGLDLKYSSREVKAILADAHARVISGEGAAVPSGTKYMFIGRQGGENLEQARRDRIERDYADSPEMRDYLLEDNDYENAIRMAEEGKDTSPAGEIRQKTGWFRGPDGRWRTEISDKNARLIHSFDQVTSDSKSVEATRKTASEFLSKELDMLQGLIKKLREQGLESTTTYTDTNETFGIVSRASSMLNRVLDGAAVKGSLPETSEGVLRLAGLLSRYEPGNVWDKSAKYLLDKLNESDIDFAPSGPRTLGDILDHPKLFAAYPDAKNIKLEPLSNWDRAKGIRGWFSEKTNSISVDGERPIASQLDTLIHEVQHYVQGVEGFAKGGNDASVIKRLSHPKALGLGLKVEKGLSKLLKRIEDRYDAYVFMRNDPLFQDLKKVLTERKDGWIDRRKDLEEKIFQGYFGVSKSEVFRNDRKNYRQMNEFLNDYVFHDIDERIVNLYAEYQKINTLYEPIAKAMADKDVAVLKEELNKVYRLPFDAYEHLFGEVEARDTANRRGMNDLERQDTTPYTSEANKIEPNDYIFDYGDDSGANSKSSIKYMLEDEKTALKENTVKKLMDHMKGVRQLRVDYENAVAESRKAKVKAMGQARTAFKGEKRFEAVRAALKGKTEKPQILPFRDKFTQREINALFDVFNDNPRLSWFESFRASAAMKKLLEGGELPSKSDLDLITRSEALPKDFLKYALEVRSRGEKMKDWVREGVSLPRAIISSMDFSAPFRQGWFMMGRKQFWKNLLPMFKHFGSKEYHEMIMDDIVNHKYYDFAKESRLFLAELGEDIATREEMFMSKTADKIPLVAGTQRAYTGFLNKLRFDTFVDIMEKYESMNDPALRIDPETDAGIEIGESLARYINNATGRGTGISAFEKAAPFLTGFLFSPRLMASRLNILFGRYNPVMWWNLHPVVRKEVAADYLKMSAITATALGLAKYAGAEVEEDLRSSDFSKIRIDGLRYDIMGGFGQYFTAAARILPAMAANAGITERAYTKNAAGQLEVLGKGGNENGWDVFFRFMRNKLAPFPGYLASSAAGEDPVGEEFHAGWDAYGAVAPLLIQDMIEAGQKDGFAGLVKVSPAILGFGVSEYERFPGEYDAYGRTVEEVEENDPVTVEMDRLTAVKDLPKPLVALATDKSLPEELPEEVKKDRNVLEQYQRVSGQYIMADLRQTMQTEEWSKMTDEEKYELVKVILRDQRANARDELFGDAVAPEASAPEE